jgi:hypothetical protein
MQGQDAELGVMPSGEVLGLQCMAMEDFVPIDPSFVAMVPAETRHHSWFATFGHIILTSSTLATNLFAL